MNDKVQTATVSSVSGVFDDGQALSDLILKSFAQAARDAVAENDRLGIITHGGMNGVVIERLPKPINEFQDI
jgi:hypothetical protein